ncbi:MAG TPA: YlxR family protein [Streptosporangiaceae bacterium]|nr:YlxR family protein [Streptosporangiaceae bacterium]
MVTRYPRQVRPAPAIRTCVGCGARAAKSDLLRLVAAGNEIVPDALARRPGRGAYLHPSQGCFKQAQRRRAFARALRQPGPLGTDRLAGYLAGPEPGPPAPGPGAA